MIIKEINGIKVCCFENFIQYGGVTQCFSTKIGGVSDGVYSSLNLGKSRGDNAENVKENYHRICQAMGFNYENLVLSSQVHKDKIYTVTEKDRGSGILYQNHIVDYDGLITNSPNTVLTTFYADCVPLFFYDYKKKVIASSHAGWRGTVLKIGEKTINKMVNDFSCNKNNIIVGIGTAICQSCFEVDKPVYNEFIKVFPKDSPFIVDTMTKGKYNIDLQELNKLILTNIGIPEENIELSHLCTKCDNDIFYSHRLNGNNRGSMAGFISLH